MTALNLYRIKRLEDGKYFLTDSNRTGLFLKCVLSDDMRELFPDFSKNGSFFKKPETIKKHLFNLCHDWKEGPGYGGLTSPDIESGPHWDRLALYSVEVRAMTVTDLASAEFMGLLDAGAGA